MAQSAITILADAWRAGRPIVAFVGAGLSAASGFPLVTEQRDYLCKVWFFIRNGIYRHLLGESIEFPQQALSAQRHPAKYLADFGWPDFNQLDADLWTYFASEIRPDSVDGLEKTRRLNRQLQSEQRTLLERRWSDLISSNRWWIDRCFADPILSSEQPRKLDAEYWKLVFGRDPALDLKWGRSRWRMATCVSYSALRALASLDEDATSALSAGVWSLKLKPRIDWSRSLLDLSEGNTARIESLLTQFNRHRKPTLAHIAFAHLSRLSFCKLVLSINFDTLLEDAFRAEGIFPSVFEVGKDADVPDASLIRKNLAIVKLHGGTFGARLGEQLDHELDERTREQVLNYFPSDGILLVIGFSGMERRMMQLLQQAVLRATNLVKLPRIVWMTFDHDLPEPVKRMQSELQEIGKDDLFYPEQVTDAGAFLLDLYQECTGQIPRTRQRFQCLDTRLRLPRDKYDSSLPGHLVEMATDSDAQIVLFYRPLGQSLSAMYAPSCAASRMADRLNKDYRVIWIDLEQLNTVGGVVLEILSRLRALDPTIPPFLVPADEEKLALTPPPNNPLGKFHRSIQAIHLALRRGRYLLVFDSLESFARPETVHHGLPSLSLHEERAARDELIQKVHDILSFLDALLCLTRYDTMRHIDWKCVIAIDSVSPRHFTQTKGHSNPTQPNVAPALPHVFETVEALLAEKAVSVLTSKSNELPFEPIKRIQVYPLERIGPPDPSSSSNVYDSKRVTFLFRLIRHAERLKTYAAFEKYLTNANLTAKVEARIHKDIVRLFASIKKRQEEECPVLDDSASLPPLRTITDARDFPRQCRNALYILCVFRRPRLHASVISVLNAFSEPDWRMSRAEKKQRLRVVLKTLRSPSVNLLRRQRHDSGTYWIPRYAHEASYKLITESIRESRIRSAGGAKTVLSMLYRLSFLGIVHSRVARHYYLHVFKRSQDPSALREYFYHRLSASKYLSLMRQLLSLNKEQLLGASSKEFRKWVKAWAAACELEGGAMNASRDSVGATDGMSTDYDALLGSVDAIRTKYLLSFRNTLARERNTLLSSLSSDAWLSWVSHVLGYDLFKCLIAELQDEVNTISNPPRSKWRREGGVAARMLTQLAIVAKRREECRTGAETRSKNGPNQELLHAVLRVASHLTALRIGLLHEQGRWQECAVVIRSRFVDLYSSWATIWRIVLPDRPFGWAAVYKALLESLVFLLRKNPANDVPICTVGELIKPLHLSLSVLTRNPSLLVNTVQVIGVDVVRAWIFSLFESSTMYIECVRRAELVTPDVAVALLNSCVGVLEEIRVCVEAT